MFILESLLQPLTLSDFRSQYLGKKPFSAAGRASPFRKFVNWDLLGQIFKTNHPDCWLPQMGRLPPAGEPGTSGILKVEEAMSGFTQGRTLLIRHSERAHPKLHQIADDFHNLFHAPINIHIYGTPAQRQGFDWHYDVEDVFIIQSSGVKEFHLRASKLNPLPKQMVSPKNLTELDQLSIGPQIGCKLEPGDWLYIPAGWWHKAAAVTDSFHLSIGVLNDPSTF